MAVKSNDDKAWDEFVSWCRDRGLKAMPANPWTFAAYARWCERSHRFPAIAKTIRAIARVHGSKSRKRPERHPTVARTLHLIESRSGAKEKSGTKRTPLFRDEDFAAPDAGAAPESPSPKTAKTKSGKTARAGKRRRKLSSRPKLVSKRRLKG